MTDKQLQTKTEVAPERGEPTRTTQLFRPNVDIVEKAEELTLIADVPGVDAESIDVNFEKGVLTLTARAAERHHDGTWLLQEYGVGDFERSFHVSEQVDAEKIHAEYANGVLTLHLPKAAAAKARRIAVQAH